jgi:hypothetical protein
VSERKRVHVDKDCQHFIAEPPAAHPPEGSQPPDCPNCDGVEGMHTLRSCLSQDCPHCRDGHTPEAGPNGYVWHTWSGEDPEPCTSAGQDVEAQARDAHFRFLVREFDWRDDDREAALLGLLRAVHAAALRAAQAEAERRAQEAEARLAEREKE